MSNPFAKGPQAPAPQPQQGPAEFGQPNKRGDGARITQDHWRSFIGHLVLFEVHGIQLGVQTDNGPADAVEADVHVIDHPDEPQLFERALVFPPALVTATKEVRDENGHLVAAAGQKPYMVLGRLAEYTTKAQRKTFQLADHSPEDVKTATDYLAWRRSQQVQQPQQAQPQQGQQAAAPQAGGQEQPPW
jgi:hypothetical protein